MKSLNLVVSVLIIFVLVSCGSSQKFPVSQVAPAAEITADVDKDKNGNYVVEIKSKYLVSPDKLTPPKNVYVVWARTATGDIVNLGLLQTTASDVSTLKTTSPYEPVELIISAEEDGTVNMPSGVEISRTNVEPSSI